MFDQKKKPLVPVTTTELPKIKPLEVPNKTETADEIDEALRTADKLHEEEELMKDLIAAVRCGCFGSK